MKTSVVKALLSRLLYGIISTIVVGVVPYLLSYWMVSTAFESAARLTIWYDDQTVTQWILNHKDVICSVGSLPVVLLISSIQMLLIYFIAVRFLQLRIMKLLWRYSKWEGNEVTTNNKGEIISSTPLKKWPGHLFGK